MSLIPTDRDVTPEWLTAALTGAGHDVRVTDFNGTQIGTGQIGKCIRYVLEFEQNGPLAPEVPRTLVGKFPSDDPESRQTGIDLLNYLREVRFYQEIQSKVSIRTPKCYFAEIEGEGPVFALLLEDMAPALPGDQIQGCSIDVARAAVNELPGLHAPLWNDPSVLEVDWIGQPDPETAARNLGFYQTLLPGFIDRYGSDLSVPQREIIEQLGTADALFGGQTPEPFGLIHVDYRLDNLLIDESTKTPTVTAVDWQSITVGSPLGDVAYFLGAGPLPDARRGVEEEIVRGYHSVITSAGVQDYPWDQCWSDYRRGVFTGFTVTVIASMLVQETARGNEMFLAMAQRHSQHALDLGSAEFLA